ncbi:hypothetical protein LEP3755_56300 [Leptolyngbya sp. NIES-3755]|nr:hypothetical protein LEP3755_56300 [Leptolyngbya sp. NIES-3755]
MQSVISTTVSHKELTLKPGHTPAVFEVMVVNTSDRFATFQIELLAPGADPTSKRRWYELAPDVATKKPPGDRSCFRVTIFDTPVPGFAGIVNLTIRTFSVELGEDRKLIRLAIEQSAEVPLRLELPVKQFQLHPTDSATIPVRIKNPGQNPAEAKISIVGLPNEWLTTPDTQGIRINPGATIEIEFTAVLPDLIAAKSHTYPFTIQAETHQGSRSDCSGTLEVLPMGWMDFSCSPIALSMPPKNASFKQWWSDIGTYTLHFANESNVVQQMSVEIQSEHQDGCVFQVFPDQPVLQPGEQLPIALTVQTCRPWLGWEQQQLFQVKAIDSDPRLDVRNDTQIVKLRIQPKLPLWVQAALFIVLLYVLWALSWLNPGNPWFGHSAAVNSIRFNGTAAEIVSAANEPRILRWSTSGFRNPLANQNLGTVGKTGDGKAARVVRYRPVDNNWIAAGLETGEIQLWNLARNQPPLILGQQAGDRVMDLAFSRDSQYLYSAHGSGKVQVWEMHYPGVEANQAKQSALVSEKQFDFAIYSIAIVGDREQYLAIAGRYNRFVLWNLETDQVTSVNYPRLGGQSDYITAIAHAENRPNLVALSDNQGFLSLWNLQGCLEGGQCELLEEWQDGHQTKPVRSIALSEQGCYLASAGADGKVMLWNLTKEGKRSTQFINGRQIEKMSTAFNSVDVTLVNQDLLIASGNDDRQVRVSKAERTSAAMCDQLN